MVVTIGGAAIPVSVQVLLSVKICQFDFNCLCHFVGCFGVSVSIIKFYGDLHRCHVWGEVPKYGEFVHYLSVNNVSNPCNRSIFFMLTSSSTLILVIKSSYVCVNVLYIIHVLYNLLNSYFSKTVCFLFTLYICVSISSASYYIPIGFCWKW